MEALRLVEAPFLKQGLPDFRPGDTVRVHVKVVEGNKERIQVFQGVVIGRKGGGIRETVNVRKVYGGVGVGITHSDGFTIADSEYDDEWSDPWFAARAGVDLLLLPKVHLDINANYRADAFNALDEAESDAITLGASIRIGF